MTVASDLRRPEAGEGEWEQRRAVLSVSFPVRDSEHDRSFFLLQRVNSSLEKKMETHSSILAWRIPWTEEPGGLLGS